MSDEPEVPDEPQLADGPDLLDDSEGEFVSVDEFFASAAAEGQVAGAAGVDELVRSDGKSVVNWPVMNQDHSAIEHMVRSDVTIMGLADAGAHAT
jgi:hypothetical protein